MERTEIRVHASFVATVNAKLEVGALQETVTVSGESPTVDTKSNLQQTVMSQEILEGIPTGRDPWSLAKLIPGVQVATYDVGGTQSMQQSGLSAHGSQQHAVPDRDHRQRLGGGVQTLGQLLAAYNIMLAGSLLSNTGCPYVSTFNVTRTIASAAGVSLTRSSQTVDLSERGDERLPSVTMIDFRISRPFEIGTRRFVPQLDIFNITNADTVTCRATCYVLRATCAVRRAAISKGGL